MSRYDDREPIHEDEARHSKGYSDTDLSSLLVAHYVAKEGMSYEDVQALTGLSRATVARRLQYAKSRGWLVETPELKIPKDMPRLRAAYDRAVSHLPLEQELLDRLRHDGVRKVTVVSDYESPKSVPYVVPRRIGHAAAERLSHALAGRDGVVGINWGWSTKWTVEFLPQPSRPNTKLIFVPLTGNLSVDQSFKDEYDEAWMCSANRLARLASEAYGAPPPRRLTTPAFINRKFAPPPVAEGSEEALRTIWSLIHEDISYQDIFGVGHHREGPKTRTALIDQMDTIVTGMSGLQRTSSLVRMAKLINEEEVDMLKRAGYVGDLGGHVIYDERAPVSDENVKKWADTVSRLAVSPKPDDFTRVARRSRETGNPSTGVFMIGRRPEKAPAFIAACRMGAVNELITDKGTAEMMLELLKSSEQGT